MYSIVCVVYIHGIVTLTRGRGGVKESPKRKGKKKKALDRRTAGQK